MCEVKIAKNLCPYSVFHPFNSQINASYSHGVSTVMTFLMFIFTVSPGEVVHEVMKILVDLNILAYSRSLGTVDFPGGPVLRIYLSMQGTWVQPWLGN